MGLHDLPSSERPHISFFGIRNAGKSSVVNAVTNQQLSIVSDTPGTTTDPVTKAMEILPLGPVVIIDTPGIDDEGSLGGLRVHKARQVLNRTDIAVLVVDAVKGLSPHDKELLDLFQKKRIPYLIAYNKSDLLENLPLPGAHEIYVSAKTGDRIHALREKIAALSADRLGSKTIMRDLIRTDDLVILVIPIDESAPKGRIILPQQETLREGLDAHAQVICVQHTELAKTLDNLKKRPALVITDSQVFKEVDAATPPDIALTSFSILMARYKGFLEAAVRGVSTIPKLKEGARILISEGCTHHRMCNDIGTVKLPRLLKKATGKTFVYETSSGRDFPDDLSGFDLVLHCGGCMVTEREMLYRMNSAEDQNVPFTNYGITIAYLNGILPRSLAVFPDIRKYLTGNH